MQTIADLQEQHRKNAKMQRQPSEIQKDVTRGVGTPLYQGFLSFFSILQISF
jgi:hypothetical protein